jgi:hypothetical protein
MTRLTGEEPLQIINQNPGLNVKELADLAGYAKTTKTGQKRVNMLVFQGAVLRILDASSEFNFSEHAPPTSRWVRNTAKLVELV